MPAFSDHELQQSFNATGLARSWELAAGQALSLRPRTAGALYIRQGRVWATLGGQSPGPHPEEAGDHFLLSGEALQVPAGRHLVLESLDRGALRFEWRPARQAGPLRQALHDLTTAALLAASALGRLLRGLAAYPEVLLLAGCRGLRRR